MRNPLRALISGTRSAWQNLRIYRRALRDEHLLRAINEKRAASGLQPLSSRGGWWPIIRESYAGAWQQNIEIRLENVMTYAAVYACVTLIAGDIAKLRPRLVKLMEDGIWIEAISAAFSPILKKPNHFQNRIQFYTVWIISKLLHGNTYVLKERDERRVVRAMYVLDPSRVRVLVAPDGGVYYALQTDWLSGLRPAGTNAATGKEEIIVPATEIIHDLMNPFYHPLIGVSPITACGLAAVQGIRIQNNSAIFFGNGSTPSGVLTAPGAIGETTAAEAKAYWEENFSGNNIGKVAVLGDGLRYEKMTISAGDSQLIDQLKWTAENVCTAFHVPGYMIGVSAPPSNNNIEALNQQYYSQTLQNPIESLELCLDEGLGLDKTDEGYGTEFDLSDLLRMDSVSRMQVAEKALKSGMKVNEVRRIYHGLGAVAGGDAVYLQQQNYSIEALAKRDAKADPFASAKQPAPADPDDDDDQDDDEDDDDEDQSERAMGSELRRELGLISA